VLAVLRTTGLTCSGPAGKTVVLPCSEQDMSTRPTPTPSACRAPGPPVDVVSWRACRLREAGFPPALAAALAAQRVDLHALLQLVDAGCPPQLAARILSPLDEGSVSG
jgi:hypothetical protein